MICDAVVHTSDIVRQSGSMLLMRGHFAEAMRFWSFSGVGDFVDDFVGWGICGVPCGELHAAPLLIFAVVALVIHLFTGGKRTA